MRRFGLGAIVLVSTLAGTLLTPFLARAQDETPPGDAGGDEAGGGDVPAVNELGDGNPADTASLPAGGDTGMAAGLGIAGPGIYTKATWPKELVHRPISLAKGMAEIRGDVLSNALGLQSRGTGMSNIVSLDGRGSFAIGTDDGLVFYRNGVYQAAQGVPPYPVTALTALPLGPNGSPTGVVAALYLPIGLGMFAISKSRSIDIDPFFAWPAFQPAQGPTLPQGSTVTTLFSQGLDARGFIYLSPRAKAAAPNPDLVLAGLNPRGVLRSTDAGSTWAFSNSGLPAPTPSVYQFTRADDGIYAATSAAVFKSTDDGVTWALANGNNGLPFLITAIAASGKTIYAGAASYVGIYKTTDGGANWQLTGPGMTGTYPQSILISGDTVFVGTNAGVFSSSDGGNSWTGQNKGTANLSVNTLLFVGGQLYAGTAGNLSGVYRSSNGGRSWATADPTMNNQYVVGVAAASGALVSASAYQLNSPSGMFRSADGGATWSLSQTGLPDPTLGLFPVAVVASGGSLVASISANASKDGVFRSEDGGATWTASRSGLPDYAAPNVLASSDATVLAGTFGSIYRSVDRGRTWAKTSFSSSKVYSTPSIAISGASAYACAYGAPGSGRSGLYVSSDGGQSWTPPGAAGLPVSDTNYPVAVAFTGSTVFAGLSGGGLYRSADGGATWTYLKSPVGLAHVTSLVVADQTLYIGTTGRGILATSVSPRESRLVPIALDVFSGTAHFTTELSLTNRGASSVPVSFLYTASLGSGSGTVTDQLPSGKQLVVGDVLEYLRGKGLSIPPASAGQQAGTLLVTFDGVTDPSLVAVTARTTTSTASPQPAGSAGLAYPAIRPGSGVTTYLMVYGLRANATDRSNVAVYNTGTEPVAVRLTAHSGDADNTSVVIADNVSLGPYQWAQYSFGSSGLVSGYVSIERVGGAGAFGGYGVINDNATNDGSFVFPSANAYLSRYLNVPVLVETSAFLSELVISNSAPTVATLDLTYVESLSPGGGSGGTFRLTLPSGRQQIIPNAIDFLRRNGVAVGPQGAASYAGALRVKVHGATLSDVYVGARTAAQSPGGGQFGLFTPAFYPGSEASDAAFIYGLKSDANNRSNVAVVNTGGASEGPITVQLQAFDGDAGGAAAGSPASLTLGPGQWNQLGNFLATKGVQNGWVRVARTAGTAPWVAYGVINDGGAPGARTGDGAYVAMVR